MILHYNKLNMFLQLWFIIKKNFLKQSENRMNNDKSRRGEKWNEIKKKIFNFIKWK